MYYIYHKYILYIVCVYIIYNTKIKDKERKNLQLNELQRSNLRYF